MGEADELDKALSRLLGGCLSVLGALALVLLAVVCLSLLFR